MTRPGGYDGGKDKDSAGGCGNDGMEAGMTRPGGYDGESNLLRPGRNPCRKSKR